jgi:hypothetical protein
MNRAEIMGMLAPSNSQVAWNQCSECRWDIKSRLGKKEVRWAILYFFESFRIRQQNIGSEEGTQRASYSGLQHIVAVINSGGPPLPVSLVLFVFVLEVLARVTSLNPWRLIIHAPAIMRKPPSPIHAHRRLIPAEHAWARWLWDLLWGILPNIRLPVRIRIRKWAWAEWSHLADLTSRGRRHTFI